jgi:hypothetical protein
MQEYLAVSAAGRIAVNLGNIRTPCVLAQGNLQKYLYLRCLKNELNKYREKMV